VRPGHYGGRCTGHARSYCGFIAGVCAGLAPFQPSGATSVQPGARPVYHPAGISMPPADGAAVRILFFRSTPMLFMVHMIVNIPATLPADEAARIKAEEKQYSQDLQRSGKWPHIWRVVGEYANVSIFDVASNDELHDALSKLPFFPYMS